MSHYYTKQGELVAYVPYADKKRAGEFRPTDLRDAKKLNLVASVTTKMQVINKPMVNDYRVRVAVDIALNEVTLIPGLRVPDDVVKSIADRSLERAMEAADFGTIIHALVSDIYHDRNSTIEHTDTQRNIAESVVIWMASNGFEVEESEFTVVGKDAAGTLDIIGKYYGDPCIVDFKTQDALDIKDFNFYPDWPIQFAGYESLLREVHPYMHEGFERRRINVVISRLIPGLITLKDWSHDKRMNNKTADKAWQHVNGYWNTVNGMGSDEINDEIVQGSLLDDMP